MPRAESGSGGGDLILAPNEFAYIQDETKGHVNVYVGSDKTSLAGTDRPVIFNEKTKRFEDCDSLDDAKQVFITAPEGWYIVLKNPAKDNAHPKTGTSSPLPELIVGHKINIPGPVSFPLWPGQMAKVIKGHRQRSDQYLQARVYDEEAAKQEWKKAVVKPQITDPESPPDKTAGDGGGESAGKEDAAKKKSKAGEVKTEIEMPDLTVGMILIIEGTKYSYYIPPTGIEVVPYKDKKESDPEKAIKFVRDAVSLEQLEQCILRDESGVVTYVNGPKVVFPKPTEVFVENGDAEPGEDPRIFRAIELNEDMGVYIKVIEPYKEDGKEYGLGDEDFITGKEQAIYFPRREHKFVLYGKEKIHYAVEIPKGEGRYVLNKKSEEEKESGEVVIVRGPRMFLADPRKEVNVRRIIPQKDVELWFPGSPEAKEYNLKLQNLAVGGKGERYITEDAITQAYGSMESATLERDEALLRKRGMTDDFQRKTSFTPPRMIILDTKYDGAVRIDVWPGYAVQVVSKTGERKVVVGPKTHLLEYDETLEILELSTDTPKSDDTLFPTVYLRVKNNTVSDLIEHAETRDQFPVSISLSYRVNFEGEPEKWFVVENYVKFLTDHMRSFIRNVVKQHDLKPFYASAMDIIRDAILREADEDSRRPGREFEENGMRIYEVDNLRIQIEDKSIERLLVDTQRDAVEKTLLLERKEKDLEVTKRTEAIDQEITGIKSTTLQKQIDLKTAEIKKQIEMTLTKGSENIEVERQRLAAELAKQESLNEVGQAELARSKAKQEQELAFAKEKLLQVIEELKAKTEAVAEKAKAITPDMIAALQAFGDKALAEKMAESMAPMALLGGKSVADVLSQLLKGIIPDDIIKGIAVKALRIGADEE